MTEKLLSWYDARKRDLPWRRSSDFYAVWLSEIMLQQTRVQAVIPYYERFLERFPDVRSLAEAPESDVLTAWSGLGYYSRARNLHRAAKQVAATGAPSDYRGILALPGVGPYTAAAVASIALGEARAAVDGNVVRVITRLKNGAGNAPGDVQAAADALLDRERPGDFNQALMELGATVCVPGAPRCPDCPVSSGCGAFAAGTQNQLPRRPAKPARNRIGLDLLLVERGGKVFLVRRAADEKRLAGFWELPDKKSVPGAPGVLAGEFEHQIVNDRFHVRVWKVRPWRSRAGAVLPEGCWMDALGLSSVPVTTISRKALTLQ